MKTLKVSLLKGICLAASLGTPCFSTGGVVFANPDSAEAAQAIAGAGDAASLMRILHAQVDSLEKDEPRRIS